MLLRGQQPFSEEVSLTVEVQGIYALPEDWISKQDDPNEQAYSYELKILGCHFKGGKFVPKENPESETIDSKAAPAKGGAKPPKGSTMSPDDDLTEEQREAIRQAEAERAATNTALQTEWATKSPQDQFHSYAENKMLEPHIEFPVIPAEGEGTEDMNTGSQTVTLTFDDLKELESLVNDPSKR